MWQLRLLEFGNAFLLITVLDLDAHHKTYLYLWIDPCHHVHLRL